MNLWIKDSIYDDSNQEIGYVEAYLAREKARIQIVRMKNKIHCINS